MHGPIANYRASGHAGIDKIPNKSSTSSKVLGGHICIVILVVRDFKNEFFDLCTIVVHLETFGEFVPGRCWRKVARK